MSERPSTVYRPLSIVMLAICLLAFVLRLGPLYDNRFHPDEALYSTWSLQIARGENLLLSGVPIDKPPLLVYLNALSFYVFGQSELAARVPNLLASVISVVLVWRLAGRLVSGHLANQLPLTNQPVNQLTNLLPPLLLALSPFDISFAPTAFLDPTMIMFGLASLVAASRGRLGWAGILLGLSFATKVQGLFFVPLVWVFSRPVDKETRKQGALLLRLAFGFAVVALLVLIWDRARGGVPFWQQQTINYGDMRLAYADELGPRLSGWLAFLPYFFGPIVGVTGLTALVAVSFREARRLRHLPRRVIARSMPPGAHLLRGQGVSGVQRSRRMRRSNLLPPVCEIASSQKDAPRNDGGRGSFLPGASPRGDGFLGMILLAWLSAIFAMHWLFNFPIWDRYFLLLVPIAALLIGRAIGHLVTVSPLQHFKPSLAILIVVIATLPFSVAAAESQYPIGGDHGANDGIEQVAVFLKGLPSGTVLYDHWLAWELDYYVGEGFVYLSYFDTPAALQDDLRVFGGANRYVIFPGHESSDRVADAIGEVGYTLKPAFTTQNRFGQTSFVVFKIEPR